MPDQALEARSALQGFLSRGRHGRTNGAAGVVLTEVTDLALISVLARKGSSAEMDKKVQDHFGCTLPSTPQANRAGGLAFLWSGPGQWLARADAQYGGDLLCRLASTFGGLASLSDQSDGRAIIRLGGARARDALANICPIDLHPRRFRPGDVALTNIAHVSALLWQVEATPVYEIAVFRSFGESFAQAVISACAEFGCDVPDER